MKRITESRTALVRPGNTVEQMVRAIADEIVTGKLRPGEKLDETTLAKRHDVSRTPVREALGQLSAMGLVDRRPNRGAVVATMSQDRLAAMFEAMAELEAICARLSALRMTPGERLALEQSHEASKRLVHGGAEEDYEAHNIEFHSMLYGGAHNVYIEELAHATRGRLAPFRRAQFRLAGRLSRSWREHDSIVRAVLRGDALGAAAAAGSHVSQVSAASASFVVTESESHAEIRDIPLML